MIPRVHFSLGPTSFDRFYQAFLPLIPGGVFIGGLLVAHPGFGLLLRNAFGFSEYADLGALVFAAYVVGFVLFASSSSVMEKIMAPMRDLAKRQQHDALWEEWYRILQGYLLRDVPVVSNEIAFVWVALQAAGWASLALCLVNPYARHWVVFVLASVFILFGVLFPFLVTLSYLSTERLSYWDFTARLLAEIRSREMQQTPESRSPHAEDKNG
jgi:hypothetical protein